MAEKRYIEKLKINNWWYWFKPAGQVNQIKIDNEYLSPDGDVITIPFTVDADGFTYVKVTGGMEVTVPSNTYLLSQSYTQEEYENFADVVFMEAWV